MEINRRIKPRQSGKTSDVLEMAEVLLSIGRKVAIIMPTDRMLAQLSQYNKAFLNKKDYKGLLFVGASTNLSFMRGIRVDCVIVDEYNHLNNQSEIKAMTQVNSAVLYTTET